MQPKITNRAEWEAYARRFLREMRKSGEEPILCMLASYGEYLEPFGDLFS
jgi:hypothetical protein